MNGEKGAALIFALFSLLLLTMLGLAATFDSSIEYEISNNYVTSRQAFAVAESGLNFGKSYLRGRNFSDILQQYSLVPAYTAETQADAAAPAGRNPITRLAARTIDFSAPFSTSLSPWEVYGLIGDPGGVSYGGGRYFIKLSDNNDEVGTSDPYTDADYKVYLRSIGVYQTFDSDRGISGGAHNSVAVVEAMLKRDLAFDLASPFALYGIDVNPANSNLFDGSAFLIDGFNHNGMTREDILHGDQHSAEGAVDGIGAIFDGAEGNTIATIESSLNKNQENNITGTGGWPSVADITSEVREGADSAQVLDANFVGKFVSAIKNFADITYSGGTSLSGNNIVLGTLAEPKVTVVEGSLSLQGNGSGAGVLIVTGDFDYSGAFDYEGVILVVGSGRLNISGANKSIIGGLFLANLTKDVSGQYSYGIPSFTLSGNSNFYYKSDSVRMGLSLLPLKVLSWREVPPELDKVN
ncbi:MAG: hypothetical protein HYX74_11455 [Acidobacteria bacterium]|nr:hypothetical protein [Acidobacteriota bacterium]